MAVWAAQETLPSTMLSSGGESPELAPKKQEKVGKKITLEEKGFACRPHSKGTTATDLKTILTKVMGLEENTTAGGLGPN